MENMENFISRLRNMGITFTIDQGRLRYGSPKGVMTPDLLEQLTARKTEIISWLEQQESAWQTGNFETPIPVMPRTQGLPLSFAQQRLWFLDQLEHGKSATYNVPPSVIRVRGTLNMTALEQALNAIIQRHEVLHSAFRIEGDQPVQLTRHQARLTLTQIDLHHLTPDAQKAHIARITREQAETPFNLASGNLLFRVVMLNIHEFENIFILTMHHIISDGWSINLFIQELSVFYHAFDTGQPAQLPTLPIQYADFAHWERQRLQGEFLETRKKYWREQLAQVPTMLELPLDFPRPRIQRYHGSTEQICFSPEFAKRLEKFCVEAKVTLFMALLGAFATLLYRYTRQEDVVIGSPIANRPHSQTEALIGLFLNTLILRVRLHGNPGYIDLLKRIKEMALAAYEHKDLPFEKLLDELKVERSLNVTPLFQVMFVLQNAPLQEIKLEGLTLTPLPTEDMTAVVDLVLDMEETPQGLEARFRYNTDLFSQATIQRMAGHFRTLLTGLLDQPRQPVATVPLLTPEEQTQLQQWNHTATDFPLHRCLHAWIEDQVEKTPEARAVFCEGRHLSYRELNIQANRLAHHLQSLGIGVGSLVGLCLERSLEMVVGLVAILKAGGAYVPLDPDYPSERLAFMMTDAQAPVLLTQTHLSTLVGQFNTLAQVICLDQEIANPTREWPTHNPVILATPAHPAYVMYTSGSTGRPKGVIISHRAICNRIMWMQSAFPLDATDRVLQKTTVCFDVSVWEFFWPLMVGAQTVLAKPGGHKESAYLVRFIQEQQITTLQFVPSMMQLFVQEKGVDACHSIRRVISGGEALRYELQEMLFARLPATVELHNLYGPTEAAIDVTHWPCRRQHPLTQVPIGRPIANTRIYILDPNLQLLPVGVPGELHIAGVQLADGYLNRPELTREKFIPDPFSPDPQARLYKTGDLVRYRPDGPIEYLGRLDFQVKIRGFRIELGEIEALLVQHATVAEAVVMARQDDGPEQAARLVAYLVPTPGHTISIPALRQYLKEKLAEHMIPAVFIPLERMPLTESGKVNRQALPKPDVNRRDLETAYVPPRTSIEQHLVQLWQEILQIHQIGIHDNFFELGGDSIKGVIFVNKLQAFLHVPIDVVALFEAPTIALFMDHLQQLSADEFLTKGGQTVVGVRSMGECYLAPIQVIARQGVLPLSFAQQRLWFLDQLEGASPTYSMPVAWHLHGQLNRQALHQSLQIIVERHEILRSCYPTVDGVAMVRMVQDPFVMQQVDLQHLDTSAQTLQVQKVAAADAEHPFNIATGPLFRATLILLRADSHVMLINMHHIISDGWSIGVLLQECGQLYAALAQGETSPLPPLPIQYVDFAAWQRTWLSGDVLTEQLTYWTRQLAGAPALLELPTDYPRPAMQRFQGNLVRFTLTREETTQIQELGQGVGASLFMTLFGAFGALLSRYSQQTDLVIGFPTANRTVREVEGLIGFFVNTLVLRLDLSANPTVEELLQQTRQTALAAYTHQDLPFEKLVDELKVERNLSHSPLFQVMFIFQNKSEGKPTLPGLILENLPQELVISKFDLTLQIEETSEGLLGTLEYNSDLFARETVERLGTHYKTLLAGCIAMPQQPIQQVPLLTATERHTLREVWNDTTRIWPDLPTLHQMVEIQCAKSPDAIAVQCAGQAWTYGELNRRANQLAHHLQTLGVKPDTLVGVCLERSLDMLLGLLAILKAGGAYVPLDPAYPVDRLAYILEDAGVKILLTQNNLLGHIPASGVSTLCLDTDASRFAREQTDNPRSETEAGHLAYVIYTSGSTGRPKGVMISHGAVVNFMWSMQQTPGFSARDSLLAVTTISFDISILELFLPLTVGGRVVIADTEMVRSGASLLQALRQEQITLMQATPATWRLLLDQDWEPMPNLTILCGGEPLPRHMAVALLEKCGTLWNMYGPTETTIWSTVQRVVPRSGQSGAVEPIGHPIANTRIYILDAHLDMVPIGVAGELCIGGAGVARGYRNRPDLTAEKFIPDPFRPGERIYKTGDLARYLADGTLDYVRRLDNQVKIRGFRIELGEIESHLVQHPAIREGVAHVHENTATQERSLVAYLVPHAGQKVPDPVELRRFLQGRLPDYMLPNHFVILDALPLTPNGKINRRALPEPRPGQRINPDQAALSSRDILELELVQIWEDVLQIRPIGIRDNFFDLGGHSLIAVRLMARIEQHFKKSLPLSVLFQGSTIEQLARIIRKQSATDPWSSLVAIQGRGNQSPFFCVAGAGGYVIYFHQLGRCLAADRPFYALQPPGLDGATAPHERVEDLAAHYIATIKGVQPHGPYYLGGHSFGGTVAYEMVRQLHARGEPVALLAILDSPAPHHYHPVGLDWSQAQWLSQLAEIIEHMYGTPLEITRAMMTTLNPEEPLRHLFERLKKNDILPADANIAHFQGFIRVYKTNLQVRYTPPQEHLPVRMVLFSSRDLQPDNLTTEKMDPAIRLDPFQGWSPYSAKPVELHVIPGDHLTMMQQPHVEILAEKLRGCLAHL
ncbi:MAG: amino acid adenylation domain-containing protein [Magnetococcales bacterium]|nr:amino acid adenylation domain-containing protein [Magnetococcales bacterium]